MKNAVIIFMALTAFLICTPPLSADETRHEKPWSRFNVNLGAYFNLNDSRVRLGGEGIGVEIDTEEVLGLDTNTTSFRLDGYWRFTKNLRHRLDFTYFSNRRKGEGTLDEELEIGDIIIDAGAQVNTTFNFDLFRVGYSYSFFQDERMDLGVGAGLYILPVEFSVQATADATGTPILDESVRETFNAPLPVINLRADFAITPRWRLHTKADLFYLEFNGYTGGIVDTRVAVEYSPFKHVGFGLAWDNFRLAAESKDDNTDIPGATFKGTFKFQNAGLMLYLKAFF